MTEKVAKKTGANKKIVEVKAVEPLSPWTEIAAAPVNKPMAEKAEVVATVAAKKKPTKVKVSKPKKTPIAAAIVKKTPEIQFAAPKIIQTSPFKDVASESQSIDVAAISAGSQEISSLQETEVVAKEIVKAKKKVSKPKAVATSPVKEKKIAPKKDIDKPTLDVTAEIAATEPKVELSAAFKALATPMLPELPRENRARLMMQTPTQLYFYWSVRENPYQLLRKAFGGDMGSYTLVIKLTEQHSGVEEIHRAEPEGDWWFNVEPNGKYEAEIGFYAPNRPYFRVIYSNTVETPRRSPSPHAATDADWKVSADKFAEVLDVAGFSEDAFEVALAGDDAHTSEQITHTAFSQFIGNGHHDLRTIPAGDIRYTLMALAAGSKIEELRSRIGASLFAILQANAANIAGGNAMNILTEYFDIDETEFTERQFGSAVFGASLVHFPRTLKTRVPKYRPLSSHSFR